MQPIDFDLALVPLHKKPVKRHVIQVLPQVLTNFLDYVLLIVLSDSTQPFHIWREAEYLSRSCAP